MRETYQGRNRSCHNNRMASDLLLAVNYANTGKDNWYFALTLTFFIIPFIFLVLLFIFAWIADDDFKGNLKN